MDVKLVLNLIILFHFENQVKAINVVTLLLFVCACGGIAGLEVYSQTLNKSQPIRVSYLTHFLHPVPSVLVISMLAAGLFFVSQK